MHSALWSFGQVQDVASKDPIVGLTKHLPQGVSPLPIERDVCKLGSSCRRETDAHI